MKVLKERILKEGRCYPGGILKVDKFINHQMDPNLMKDIAVEFIRRFASSNVNKILTIEASGISTAPWIRTFSHPLFTTSSASRSPRKRRQPSGSEYTIRLAASTPKPF